MHKSATKCNETIGKWCKNKHGASKIIDTFETYHGARTALTLAKAHYPELDLDLITSGIPEGGEDGAPMDEAAIRQSVLGYDEVCALGTQLNVYYKAYNLPGSPSQASASVSAATAGADGGEEVSSGVPPST
jgi:hypothetical protein